MNIKIQLSNVDQCLANRKDPSKCLLLLLLLFVYSFNKYCVIAIVAMVITHDYSNLEWPQGPGERTHCSIERVGF